MYKSISASQIGYQLVNPPTVTLTAAIPLQVFKDLSASIALLPKCESWEWECENETQRQKSRENYSERKCGWSIDSVVKNHVCAVTTRVPHQRTLSVLRDRCLHNKVPLDVKYENKMLLTVCDFETGCRFASETETDQQNLKSSCMICAILDSCLFFVCNTICALLSKKRHSTYLIQLLKQETPHSSAYICFCLRLQCAWFFFPLNIESEFLSYISQ